MNYERIDDRPEFDAVRDSHEVRYRIASSFIEYGDTVLDAGCGTGYGRRILTRQACEYIGVDRNPVDESFTKADLENPAQCFGLPPFDVFVGLEIIEHLDPVGYFIQLAKTAKKWIVVSTPIKPNTNPYHKQQFTEAMMLAMFVGEGWKHYQTLYQSDGLYGIFIFKRT